MAHWGHPFPFYFHFDCIYFISRAIIRGLLSVDFLFSVGQGYRGQTFCATFRFSKGGSACPGSC